MAATPSVWIAEADRPAQRAENDLAALRESLEEHYVKYVKDGH